MRSNIFISTEAVGNIVKFLGMQPCERSDKVPDNKNSHTLYLAGEFLYALLADLNGVFLFWDA